MTYDEMMAAGAWSGDHLVLRQRMADYLVDGSRLGAMDLQTKSGSTHDVHLDKRTSEILTAALLLSYLKYEGIRIRSLDDHGETLERPDLDVRLPNGNWIGVEVADASDPNERRHEAGRNLIDMRINELLETDPSFESGFGSYHFAINLNGIETPGSRELESKKEAEAIAVEIERFVRAQEHRVAIDDFFGTFERKYPALHARAAQYHAAAWEHGSYFSVNDGAGTVDPSHDAHLVLRVLERHRASAVTYRSIPTWIVLFLTDTMEFFRNTVAVVAAMKPPIAPFERAYVVDSAGRLACIQEEL